MADEGTKALGEWMACQKSYTSLVLLWSENLGLWNVFLLFDPWLSFSLFIHISLLNRVSSCFPCANVKMNFQCYVKRTIASGKRRIRRLERSANWLMLLNTYKKWKCGRHIAICVYSLCFSNRKVSPAIKKQLTGSCWQVHWTLKNLLCIRFSGFLNNHA